MNRSHGWKGEREEQAPRRRKREEQDPRRGGRGMNKKPEREGRGINKSLREKAKGRGVSKTTAAVNIHGKAVEECNVGPKQ